MQCKWQFQYPQGSQRSGAYIPAITVCNQKIVKEPVRSSFLEATEEIIVETDFPHGAFDCGFGSGYNNRPCVPFEYYDVNSPFVGSATSSGSFTGVKALRRPFTASSTANANATGSYENRNYIMFNMVSNIDDRIAGKDPNVATAVYSTFDYTNGIYVRNINCWAYDVDLTFRTTGIYLPEPDARFSNWFGVNLVTPKHVLTCMHFALPVGTVLRFIDNDNNYYDRTVMNNRSQVLSTDIGVILLDSDLPAQIKPAKLLPSSISTKFWPTPVSTRKIPLFVIEQTGSCLIHDIAYPSGTPSNQTLYTAAVVQATFVTSGERAAYRKFPNPSFPNNPSLIAGDSGSPIAAIINDEVVLFSQATGSGSGANFAKYAPDIQSVIDTLSPGEGYTLSYADISEFE